MKESYELMERHLMEDATPSKFFNEVAGESFLKEYPFYMLLKLKEAKQSPQHHPEGDVWKHTMMVVDEAAKVKHKSKDSKAFMWAALLHDIGKPDTTRVKKGKITSYNHEKVGAELAKEFLYRCGVEESFVMKVAALIRWHMQILFVVNGLPFAEVKKMKEEASVEEVALLGWCDRMGRGHSNKKVEKENMELFLQKCILTH
jgi:tRNA nucleotidyltransferase (CCA-adding enzyme)